MTTKNSPRILLLDIETFPNIAYVWGKYQQDVIRFKQESCIATFVAKWLNDSKVIVRGLPDYSGYKPGSYDDSRLVKDLWKLLDEADVVIAHNGDSFDIKVCNARFLTHGMTPPSPFKTVDTKLVAKKVARFNSNKLDDLASNFGMGKKIKTDFDLWDGCINGVPKYWKMMLDYNKRDVLLLEQLYLRLRPWTSNHPNFTGGADAMCPKCQSTDIQFRGVAIASTRQYRRFQCKVCGGWGRVVKCEKTSAKVTNA